MPLFRYIVPFKCYVYTLNQAVYNLWKNTWLLGLLDGIQVDMIQFFGFKPKWFFPYYLDMHRNLLFYELLNMYKDTILKLRTIETNNKSFHLSNMLLNILRPES